MSANDPSEDQAQGFSIDIGDILKEVTRPRRRTTRRTTTTRRAAAGDVDAAIRRAVRVELAGVERAVRELADEVARLRRVNEELAEKIARALRS